jgi:8-oxo-dGTP pyrophosphatase MutT (NUDIX family)
VDSTIVPDPAATIILLRPGSNPFEVLMVRRHSRGFFGDLVVFPGGGVDDIDRSELARRVVAGAGEDADHRAAALRELAEEAGFTLVGDGAHTVPDLRGEDMYLWHEEKGWSMPGDGLVLVSRWVTPEMAPRRFDTIFYLAAIDSPPEVRLDSAELIEHFWVTPREAIARYESGDFPMVLPTLAHLRWLARRSSVSDAFESALGADGRSLIKPERAHDGSIVPVLLPADSP